MKRALLPIFLLAACGGEATDEPTPPERPATSTDEVEKLPEPPRIATVTMPGGELAVDFVEVTRADGSSFWIATTETTWPVFKLFVLRPDEEMEVDGITGPSRSVFPIERGYGTDGMPALGMTFNSAQSFCTWLNGKDLDHNFRLPTEEEWKLAAGEAPSDWDAAAWHAANAEGKPHPVATKAANQFGIFDMGGNVSEWVTSTEEDPLALGGSWQQEAGALGAAGRQQYDLSWQQRDPQWPKSVWWMSDAGFVGFRLVMD